MKNQSQGRIRVKKIIFFGDGWLFLWGGRLEYACMREKEN